MTDQEVLKLAWEAATEKKGQDPLILDLRGVSRVADYFLLVGAENTVQVKAIADRIDEVLAERGMTPLRREGYQYGRWILLDFGFLVVHVMHRSEREFYRLEQLWHDAAPVQYSDL